MAGAPGASVSASRCKRGRFDTSRRTRPFRSPNLRKHYWSAPAPDSLGSRSGICRRRHLTLAKSGRTFSTTRAGGHTALFWTNDQGFYVLDDKVAASKLREVETREERSRLADIYRAQRRTLKPSRLDIPRRVPPMSAHDLWDSNRPGSTLPTLPQ